MPPRADLTRNQCRTISFGSASSLGVGERVEPTDEPSTAVQLLDGSWKGSVLRYALADMCCCLRNGFN